MASALAREMDEIRALGSGAIGLVNAALLLAIVAVVLAGPQTASVIRSAFALLTWLVGQVVTPLQPVGPTAAAPPTATPFTVSPTTPYAPGTLPGMTPGTTTPPFLWTTPEPPLA